MKVVKILLGVIFGIWAISALALGIKDNHDKFDFSIRGITEIAVLVSVFSMLVVFSIWFFQSAFKKKMPLQTEIGGSSLNESKKTCSFMRIAFVSLVLLFVVCIAAYLALPIFYR